METVFVLQHSYEKDGYDETKFIGVYSTNEQAEQAVKRLKERPGFRDRQTDFHIDKYELNQDHWTEGYSVMTTIKVKRNDNTWTTVEAECLANNTYKIFELYENDTLGEFKHLDIVECEEKNNDLYAVKLVRHDNS